MFQGLQLPRVEVGINPHLPRNTPKATFQKASDGQIQLLVLRATFFCCKIRRTLLIRQEKG
jgi:hypothetical protein